MGRASLGLDFSGSGRGCNTVAGTFTVNQIATNPDGSIAVPRRGVHPVLRGGYDVALRPGPGRRGPDPHGVHDRRSLQAPPADGKVGLTATVAAPTGTPSGQVTFREGDTTLGSAAVGGDGKAYLVVPGLARGSHTLTADYAGSADHLPSTGSATVVLPGIATTTTMTAPRSAKVGKPLSVTATVSSTPGAAPATGQVGLYDGVEPVGTATLVGSRATITWSPAAKGTHSLTVRYLGDATHAASVSSAVAVKVT